MGHWLGIYDGFDQLIGTCDGFDHMHDVLLSYPILMAPQLIVLGAAASTFMHCKSRSYCMPRAVNTTAAAAAS